MTILEAFGNAVRHKRMSLHMSQEDLAAASGLHRTYIGSVERGERNVSLLNIVRISTALDVSPSELMTSIKTGD